MTKQTIDNNVKHIETKRENKQKTNNLNKRNCIQHTFIIIIYYLGKNIKMRRGNAHESRSCSKMEHDDDMMETFSARTWPQRRNRRGQKTNNWCESDKLSSHNGVNEDIQYLLNHRSVCKIWNKSYFIGFQFLTSIRKTQHKLISGNIIFRVFPDGRHGGRGRPPSKPGIQNC